MGDLLDRGSAFLEDQRHRHMTRPVVYRRGATTKELPATVGRTVFEQMDADGTGLLRRVESRDFLVRAADLDLGSGPTTPRAGDQIREARDGRVLVYEVNAPGGEPPFRSSDPFGRTLRIHTKHIGTEG